MTITTHHQPYLLIYKLASRYTAPLKNTVTALLEYLDLTAIRVYRSFKQVFRGPFMGLLGPLSGWGPGKMPQ